MADQILDDAHVMANNGSKDAGDEEPLALEKITEISEEKTTTEERKPGEEVKDSARSSSTCKYDEAAADGETDSSVSNVYENEYYRWCKDTQKWIPKMTDVIAETEHFRWDAEKKDWVPKVKETETSYGVDEDGLTVYKDKDGVVFFWDVERKAWFPKVDDDMLARYQMNYGFTEPDDKTSTINTTATTSKIDSDNITADEEIKTQSDTSSNTLGMKKKPTPAWFQIDPEHNTKVYVTNLPLDMTLDEFAELMGKCGMITRDVDTQKYKIKLYAEPNGQLKGDGLCDYIKVESVELALNILDDYEYRGHKLSVQRAKFQMRGDYNPSLKPKRRKKDKEKIKKLKEKLFDWRPERMRGERAKHERVVIIKNYFHPKVFEDDVQLLLEYKNNLIDECSKCGTVYKVVLYDRHEEGVAQINMSTPEEADLVIQMMQGRYFGKRQLTADHWDGKTKYKINESENDTEKRLSSWENYLESEEAKDKTKKDISITDSKNDTTDGKDGINNESTEEAVAI